MPRLSDEKKKVLEAMTRDSLYIAAKELLEEYGWRGMTMEKLARKAGMAKGTVYNYFSHKAEILAFITERDTAPLREKVRQIDLERSDPVEVLERVLREVLQGMIHNRRTLSAVIRATHEDRDLQGGYFFREEEHPMWEVRVFLRKVIRLGVERGQFRPVNPVIAEELIQSVIMGLGRQLAVGDSGIPIEEFMASMCDIALNGLLTRGDRQQ